MCHKRKGYSSDLTDKQWENDAGFKNAFPRQLAGKAMGRMSVKLFIQCIDFGWLEAGKHLDESPFDSRGIDLVTLRNIISRPLLPPRVKNPTYSAEMEQVLVRCLQKDPEKRYARGSEFAGAIREFLKNYVMTANA